MTTPKHEIFISHHHEKDQCYKESLLELNKNNNYSIFTDVSVDTGDIDDGLSDEAIRKKIRDEYLKESSVTILLVGEETKNRKHIDWEIYSSMFNGEKNKKSGILVIQLPSIGFARCIATHGDKEKSALYPDIKNWRSIKTRKYCEEMYPYMPKRIIDNLLNYPNSKISITNLETITSSPYNLKFLIDLTCKSAPYCNYDLSTPMRRANS